MGAGVDGWWVGVGVSVGVGVIRGVIGESFGWSWVTGVL